MTCHVMGEFYIGYLKDKFYFYSSQTTNKWYKGDRFNKFSIDRLTAHTRILEYE